MTDKPAAGFIAWTALKGRGPASPSEILAEIRQIYFKTTRQTILHDLAHAIELLKALPDEETRDKAAVYMEGLAQMRNEWLRKGSASQGKSRRARGKR